MASAPLVQQVPQAPGLVLQDLALAVGVAPGDAALPGFFSKKHVFPWLFGELQGHPSHERRPVHALAGEMHCTGAHAMSVFVERDITKQPSAADHTGSAVATGGPVLAPTLGERWQNN